MVSRIVHSKRMIAALMFALVVSSMMPLLYTPIVTRAQGGVYRTPITITERSGSNLYNYSVRITLNSNFDGWSNITNSDGSDIYFIDQDGNPLYYWIESFNISSRNAVIWVNVPFVPANGNVTIYMYYGGTNPYPSYRDPNNVFLFYDDFTGSSLDTSKWAVVDTSGGSYSVSNGMLTIAVVGDGANWKSVVLKGPAIPTYHAVEAKVKWTYASEHESYILDYYASSSNFQGMGYRGYYDVYVLRAVISNTEYDTSYSLSNDNPANFEYWRVTYTPDGYVRVFRSTDGATWTKLAERNKNIFTSNFNVAIRDTVKGSSTSYFYIDWIRVRNYVSPEPSVNVGVSVPVSIIYLPQNSVMVVHDLAYSPNSTQFTHSFTATNTSTAGYAVNYSDAYGWMVYANPSNGGVNTASLVSSVNISLPYSSVLVDNVTLLARTNGTGGYRQLWIRVMNSSGGVVAELTNASIGVDWTTVSLLVNTSLSEQVMVWINATVGSTASSGEEIDVKDVRVYARYITNPLVSVSLTTNPSYNITIKHSVSLGSVSYLNSSIITFKLIQYLTFNGTDYPVQPVYVGNEIIGSYSYNVYVVNPANYSQTMTIYASLENKLRNVRMHVRGYDTSTVLVGEPLTIELPVVGNITIRSLNLTYLNMSSITLSFSSPGTYLIEANVTQPSSWMLGYWIGSIMVKYGGFSVRPLDLDSKNIDYENLVLQLVDKNNGSVVREVAGNRLFNLGNLVAGNYTLIARFKGIIVGSSDFWLNTTTDGSTISLPCAMRVMTDYRGMNRSVIYGMDKQLQSVESLSDKYPYSRMRLLLNGSGSFTLYVNYYGDLPSKVVVTGNVSRLKYYWDGNYLVITGILGSLGELNITELYKVRVEIYDRLGNFMPSWMYGYINETMYSGGVMEGYYYPDDYVITLPEVINRFEFYGFFDGFSNATRVISLNNTDIVLKVWYRVPTDVVGVKGYQVASMFLPLFIMQQNSDTATVYIDGVLRDYYSNGVPNRPLVINVTDPETGFAMAYNVTTDAGGYFRSPLLQLIRGKTYRIVISYNGDDIYVGSVGTTDVTPEELPVAPATIELSIGYLIIGVAAVAIIMGIVAVVRAARHVIEDLREESRRFVKKK